MNIKGVKLGKTFAETLAMWLMRIKHYEPFAKCQSSVCKSSEEQKVRLQKSKVKTMLVIFIYDLDGIIHKEFVSQDKTVNGDYLGVTKRLARIGRVRPQYRTQDSWLLLHDNVPAHKCIARNSHSPYSPDLACDYVLFPKLKMKLKEKQFDTVLDI